MSERRAGRRMRALKGAKIFINGRRSTIDCQVRNISETGAKLSVVSTISVPEVFEIRFDQDGKVRGCQVAWRTLTELGVRFSDQD